MFITKKCVEKKLTLWQVLALVFVLSLCSCVGRGSGEAGNQVGVDNVAEGAPAGMPAYARETTQIQLTEGFNQFIMDFSEYGILYFQPTGDSYQNYDFYFWSFAEKANSDCIFQKEGGYLRDLSAVKRQDGMHYCLLWVDEDAGFISDYDSQGRLSVELTLADEGFEKPGKFPIFQALSQGGYLIGLEDKVYHVSEDGRIEQTIATQNGIVRRLIELEDGRCFVVCQGALKNGGGMSIAELTAKKDAVETVRSLPVSDERVFPFEENGLVYCDGEYAYLFGMDETKDEKLVNLKRKNIIASQIQCLCGNREEIFLISVDQAEGPDGILGIRLTRQEGYESEEESGQENAGSILKNTEKKRQKYAPDGRRIIHVAVPKEAGNAWVLEFRGQKYSQKKDQAVVEVEEFEGTMEDYLGRGERPDVIVLPDQTAIAPLVELGALADMNPLYEKQEKYSLEDVLPKAREALSVSDGLYAMGKQFQLLLCSYNGALADRQGNCTTLEYLQWYDDYLSQNDVQGMPDLNELFFALLPDFYDEGEGKANFESEEFKEFMREFKKLRKKHEGEWVQLYAKTSLDNNIVNRLSNGPHWVYEMLTEYQLIDPSIKLSGIPTTAGTSVVYMKIDRPMAILNASECKEEAFDFILYYCRSKMRECSDSGGSVYEMPPSDGQTLGTFWLSEQYLTEDIWETEKPCWYQHLVEPTPGSRFEGVVQEFTEEHKEMLRGLLDTAVGVTKAQNDIYGMFLEEMDGYLHGNKDLDSCCEILQNRVSLYLAE